MSESLYWVFYKNNWHHQIQSDEIIPKSANRIYEVLRVINGIPLFLEDHYARFEHSLEEMELQSPLDLEETSNFLIELIKRNNLSICNIRFEVVLEDNELTFACFHVPFKYPLKEAYLNGVSVSAFHIERNNPHIKQSVVNNKIREKLKSLYKSENIFEVLLIDHNEYITEGSRTNVFFVKDGKLYSPPSENILEGITRKKVLQIASKHSIEALERTISLKEIDTFDACFITGTSPKVLPVKNINGVAYSVENSLVSNIMNSYEQLIQSYCTL